jgi:hypothetical protein
VFAVVFSAMFAAVSALLISSAPVPASRWIPKNSVRLDALGAQRMSFADDAHL